MKTKKAMASLVAASVVATTLATAQPVITQAATNLEVSVPKCTLQVGKKMTVSANQKVTWKSSNKKVATVKKVNGKKAKITAKKKGTCKVTAIAGKKKAVVKVTVKKAQVQSVAPTVASENTSNEASDTQVYMNETCGVSICLSDVKTTEGTIVIENNSGTDIAFGLDYSIEKYENGQWTKLTSNPVAIPSIAVIVFNGCSYTSNLNWAGMYGGLAQGTYRVVKQVSVNEQGDKKIASQFVIDEKTEIGATSTPTLSGQAGRTTDEPTVVVPPQTADPAYNGPMHTLSPEEKEMLDRAIPSDNMPIISEYPTISQETSEKDTQVYMDETCGVSISLSDVKTTGGTITIANNSGNDFLFFRLDYTIEKYEDSQWKVLSSNPVAVPEIGIMVENGKKYTMNLDWTKAYGSLPQGTYRVVKQVSVNEQGNKKIASQFVVDQKTETEATSVSNPQETSQADTQVYMNETCGVSISLSDVKTTGGTITIVNNNGNEVTFGLGYFIEKYEDDQWKTLSSNPIAIPALAIGLLDEETYTNTINWADSYGSLSQGTYRVVKQVSVQGKGIKKIASQFVIDENTEVGVTNESTVTEQSGVPTATPAVITLP